MFAAAKSPFPGMDPYLEAHWGDVRSTMTVYMCGQLQDELVEHGLRARIGERVYDEYPDRPMDDPVTETFVKIQRAGSRDQVVTVIDLINPSNKELATGRTAYQEQQGEWKRRGVNIVEIDLLRCPGDVGLLPRSAIPDDRRSPYKVGAWRAQHDTRFAVWLIQLRNRLPVIAVPLGDHIPDVSLDLQSLIDKVYQTGAYDDIDYTVDPDPPLEPDDAAWADALLKEKGVRQ